MREVELLNAGNGVAVELFQREIQKVADNIADMNTKPDDEVVVL